MSYDLMVFDPDLAPAKRKIEAWFGDLMEAEGDHDSSDPVSAGSARLKAFYDDMRTGFPAMNGPDAGGDVDSDRIAGYEFHPGFVYMDFRYSAAEAACKAVIALAKTHRLGLYDPQDPDGVQTMGSRQGEPVRKASWWARLFGG